MYVYVCVEVAGFIYPMHYEILSKARFKYAIAHLLIENM